MLKCPNPEAKTLFIQKVGKELKETLEKESTCPNLQDTILDALKPHLHGYRHGVKALYATPELKDVIQELVGIILFLDVGALFGRLCRLEIYQVLTVNGLYKDGLLKLLINLP